MAAPRVTFQKYEGLGNDFILIEADHESAVVPARAAALCDRRLGIGGDGVILILPALSPEHAARMRVLNADGSIPEMCGNGVRCLALHVARAHRERVGPGGVVAVETDAGLRRCNVEDADGEGLVTVDMGTVRVGEDVALDIEGQRMPFTVADAGNPHAVLLGAFARGEVERLGPRLATHAMFPRGTNVEFAHVHDGAVDLVVWERGVGITLACGTGACATAAVACEKGLLPKGTPALVRLPGGALEITIGDGGRTTMRGPARHVFSGELPSE